MLGNDRASAGSGGVGRGCTTLSGCSTAIECDAMDRKLPRRDRSHKPRREANGGAQCGKSACCVATWRGLETWYGRDALTNWRASPRPYREVAARGRSPKRWTAVVAYVTMPGPAVTEKWFLECVDTKFGD